MRKITGVVLVAATMLVPALPAQAYNDSDWSRMTYQSHSNCIGRILVHGNLRVRCTDGYVATIRPDGTIKNEKYV